MPVEDIAPFRFPFGRDAALRALEAAKVPCDHHLLLDRHRAACQQKRRDWPHRMLVGDGWHGVEEYRQALIDAPHVPGDKRRRPWGPTETRNHLMRLVDAGLVIHDIDNDRFREPHNKRHPLVRPEVSERHNAKNRARYHDRVDAERAHAQSLNAQYGPICGPTHPVSTDESAGLRPYNAPESNSPAVYKTEPDPNHSARGNFLPAQPPASAADLDSPLGLGRIAAVRGLARHRAELQRELEAQYRASGNRLGHFDDDDAVWVADWLTTHAGLEDLPGAMMRRHRHWRLKPKTARLPEAGCVKQTAKSKHIGVDLVTKAHFFNISREQPAPDPYAAKAPLVAQPTAQLAAHRKDIWAVCQSAKAGRAPTQRLADIDALQAALSDRPATARELHSFCETHPWASNLTVHSAVLVGGSLALWAYVARRMETKDEPATSGNAAGLLLWRVRQWVRAQATDKGYRRGA